MANGIEDLMNIRTTGGTQNVPPRPPMQGGLASMGAGQPTMPPVVDDQMSMPPMGGQECLLNNHKNKECLLNKMQQC